MKSGKFRVFERAALDELLAEKNLSMSDLANPGASAEQKLEIGDILVKASITEFGYKESKTGGGLVSGALKKASVGSYTGRVAVDIRLIDIGTGEVCGPNRWTRARPVAPSASPPAISPSATRRVSTNTWWARRAADSRRGIWSACENNTDRAGLSGPSWAAHRFGLMVSG
ncbi:MAG: CsgG/HfaB family protein [bacterium]